MMAELLSQSNCLLNACSANLWQACWQGGLVVLVVWAILLLFPAMPARCQCWCWRLAMLKFVIVLLLPSLFDVPILPARAVSGRLVCNPVVVQAIPVHETQSDCIPTLEPQHQLDLMMLLQVCWLLGVAFFLFRLLFSWLAVRNLIKKGSTICAGQMVEQLQMQCTVLGLKKSPRLLEIPGGGSPMLFGLFRPTLVMPTKTWRCLTLVEQTMVLGHEVSHIRRHDIFWSVVASLIRAVFFFHPLVWLGERQLKIVQEIAADELAIIRQHCDSLGYGRMLVSVVEKLGKNQGVKPLHSSIVLETAGPIYSLTRRLVAMSRIGRVSRRVLLGSVVLLVAVVLLGVVPWRLVAAEATENENQPQHFFQVKISCKEREKETLMAPTLTYSAGQSVFASLPYPSDKSRRLIVTIAASATEPFEHAMLLHVIRDPNGNELTEESIDQLAKQALEHVKDIGSWGPNNDLPKDQRINIAMPDGFANIQCNGKAKWALNRSDAKQGGIDWMSPIVHVASGTTGEIRMNRQDGMKFNVSVAIASTATSSMDAQLKGHESQKMSHLIDKNDLTLADYEAIPNQKNPGIWRRPYRMDSSLFGIVIVDDEKGNEHLAGINKSTGEWQWLKMPKNDFIWFEPMMSDDVVAFLQHGSPISQLAIYNGRMNRWTIYPLSSRVIDVMPCVGDRMVCYQLPDRVVAYSAEKDVWGMFVTEAEPMVGDDSVWVDTPNGRYEFPDENGNWAAAKSVAIHQP